MEIKSIIIEDEMNARSALKNMLDYHCPEISIVGEAGTVKEAVDVIKSVESDLLFLDVNLPDGTSFDILKKIKREKSKIVFITAHDEYALQAIKMCALDYLLKPVKPDDLRAALNKVKQAIENEERYNLNIDTCIDNYRESGQQKKIILNTAENMFVLEIKNIIRCEASENYSTLHLVDEKPIMVAKTLKEFEEMLSPFGFFRLHQSHLVNLRFVSAYEKKSGGHARLHDGQRLPVSKRRKEGFLKALEASIQL